MEIKSSDFESRWTRVPFLLTPSVEDLRQLRTPVICRSKTCRRLQTP